MFFKSEGHRQRYEQFRAETAKQCGITPELANDICEQRDQYSGLRWTSEVQRAALNAKNNPQVVIDRLAAQASAPHFVPDADWIIQFRALIPGNLSTATGWDFWGDIEKKEQAIAQRMTVPTPRDHVVGHRTAHRAHTAHSGGSDDGGGGEDPDPDDHVPLICVGGAK